MRVMIRQMSKHYNQVESWQQNLRAMWFTELMAIVGFAVVIPILPLYLRVLGVEGDRQISIWSGVVVAAPSVTMAIFAPIWGVLSDRHGRKVMVERAMFAGAVTMTLMGFAQSPQQLTILRALQGALTGTVTASTALVASSVPDDRAGYALGTLQTAIYVGASAGPLLGGLVADSLGYRAAFLVTGGLLLTAAVAVHLSVEEPLRRERAAHNPTTSAAHGQVALHRRVWRYLTPVLGSAPILAVLSLRLLARLGARLTSPTLPLFVETIAAPGARVATTTGLITGVAALGGAVGGRQLGQLGDRVGYRSVLIACALLSIVSYAPQALVGRPIWLLPLQAGAGLAMGGILASVRALLAALGPKGREGIIYGVENTVSSIGSVIGPITGSALAAGLGLRAPFLASAAVFAVGLLAAIRLLPEQ